MKQRDIFGSAKWIGRAERSGGDFAVIRRRFTLSRVGSATLWVLGLGFFKCYINGTLINPDTFLPLSSDFEKGQDPEGEILTAHRVYVPRFDVTPYLREGDNAIAIHYGGGWYTLDSRPFGLPKAIYRISVEGGDDIVSGKDDRIGASYVAAYHMRGYEKQDFSSFEEGCLGADFDDSGWENAVPTEPLESEYCLSDCPPDALMATLIPKNVGRTDTVAIYDCGENTVGVVSIRLTGKKGDFVRVRMGEELTPDGRLDPKHWHHQRFEAVDDGSGRVVRSDFTWFCFRYFEIEGSAVPVEMRVIHADVKQNSSFETDNETLNWTYRTFLHTMQCNMHTGHPSDCPHLERLGYTGDGQVTCHAVLSSMDARAFYRKWMQDISDCQDTVTGRIQYTAPYYFAGGGPGGWGCAIVEVPYQYYLHYGDPQPLEQYYPQMRRYIDFLGSRSENGLVTSNKPGLWCLGDWCGPMVVFRKEGVITEGQQIILPAAYINTYFMVKCLRRLTEIARIIGKEEDIPAYEQDIQIRCAALKAAYFNAFDNNFLMNIQGANAFAVDLGIGTERTYNYLADYYNKVGHYDTGIFGTDVVTRVLFEHGDAETAVRLLTDTESEIGYDYWRRTGATTFREYWQDDANRSHCHPMFGSTVAYFFEYILGVRQKKGTAGYRELVIEPVDVSSVSRARGHMTVNAGIVSVDYEKTDGRFTCHITLPAGIAAEFRRGDTVIPLSEGKNEIVL